MTTPTQKRHRSEQVVSTPRDFIAAVQARFGPLVFDLAATRANSVCLGDYLGPGSSFVEDAFTPGFSWAGLGANNPGYSWLNPEYANIGPWAERCVTESAKGLHVLMLAPAAVGSEWFNAHVRPNAYVFELTPRLKFVGHAHAYPKDLILACFGPERFVGRASWRWKTGRRKPAQ